MKWEVYRNIRIEHSKTQRKDLCVSFSMESIGKDSLKDKKKFKSHIYGKEKLK